MMKQYCMQQDWHPKLSRSTKLNTWKHAHKLKNLFIIQKVQSQSIAKYQNNNVVFIMGF
jgi:hypothetical protein